MTAAAVEAASRKQGWPLQYHTSAQVTAAIAHLAELYDPDTGEMRRPMNAEEIRWIQNERALCALDFRYWASKYANIINWEKRVSHFYPNVAQAIILDLWAEAEDAGLAILLQALKARQLGICLVPSTRILTADLRWVTIDDVAVGERLVAVDEYPIESLWGGRRMPRQLRTAVVEAKIDRMHETETLVLDTGVEITGTGEHPLLCALQTAARSTIGWKRIREIQPGDRIRQVTSVWEPGDYEDAWLGGLIDGEGCLRPKERAGVELSVSQVSGAVLDRARALMQGRYAYVREEVDRRDPGTSSTLGSQEVHKLVVGRMGDLFRLLGRTRPTRFIGREWWEGKELSGKKIGGTWATVLAKRPAGRQRVVDLQTSTGTYIAEGVVSHNTTITELAVAHRVQFVPYTTAAIASADPKKTVEMGRMIAFCWETQPWWLMHTATKIEKGMPVEFGAIHSSILVQAGNQFHGVARGQTPNVFHLCLASHTLIRVADGFLKPIQEVTPEDRVLTHTGAWASVRACCESPRKNELGIDLWLWGAFAPMSSTRDHPVRVAGGWKDAKDLRVGDWVQYPVRAITHTRTHAEYFKWTVGGDWKVPFQERRHKIPSSFPLSRDWGWVIGLYLAEGSLQKTTRGGDRKMASCVMFSIDQDEVPEVTTRLEQILGPDQHLGVHRRTSRSCNVGISNCGLARWFHEEIGDRDQKRVPDWAWEAGEDFCVGLVEGYLYGDGHYVPNANEIHASSIRVQLPIQMRELLASLGQGWSGIVYKQAGVYFERNCKAQWTLLISGEVGRSWRERIGVPFKPRAGHGSGGVDHWRYAGPSVIEIEVSDVGDSYSPAYYDLEVDHPDHSFTTAQCAVRNSEIASWNNAEDDIDASLLKAVHETPNVFGVLESTAEGRDNWWYENWQVIKVDYPRGRSRLRPLFLPWFVGIDIYPPKADLRARPVPPDWIPTDRTVNHAERARQYVLTNPALFKYLAKGNPEWTLPRHQQWYYEIERDAAQRKGHLNKFLAEVPADDEECFQSTAISVIDQEVVQSYKEKVREPLGVYAIVGDGIHASLVPPRSQWWTGPEAPPVITIHCAEVLRSSETYQFIPLKFDGYPTYDPMGKLFIYEWPEQGEAYGFGVDTGDGIGQDWSVIEGLRKGNALHPHSQCCEWACLAPGSLVVCPDGVRPIESIEAGSRVITRTGATGIVGWTKKTRRPASVEIFTGLATNVPLHLTDDHPVATLGGWVPAGQLHPKDWLRYPVRPFLSLDRSPLEIEYKYKKYQIPFTWEFGFLCGLYLAEGHASHNRGGSEPQAVNFTINRRELPPWLPILQSVCPVWHLGVATPTNTKNARRISISCTTLAKWLKQEFGHTRGKHLPAWLWEAPRAFAEGVAFGMVAGDGSIDRRCNSVNYTSICVSLVVGLRDLALSLGWGLGIISHWKRGKVAGPCWILQFYGESGLPFIDSKMIRPLPQATVRHVTRAFRWGWNKECIYVRVARVLPKGPGEFVDLHVLGEEPSFCTIQAAVHNSPYVKADQLWPMALALGCFYSVFNPVAQRRTQSRVAVECRGNGEIAQKELQMRGWVNFHPWKRYDRKRPMQTKDVHQWGVFTNVWFRSMMMDRLLTTIDEESLEIGSPWFVSEMATLERDVDEQSARAAYKTHDDRIMALGFILFSMTIDDMPGRASYRRSTPNYLPESMIASGGYGRAAMPCASTPPGPATYATYRSPSTAHSGPPEATLGVGAGSSRLGAAAAPAILRKLGMLEAALGRRRGR